MTQEPYHSNWSDELKRKVVDYITEHSGGIFRWADLLLEELRSKAREKDIDRTFKLLPKDMEESYSRILQQIDRDGYARDAQVIFTWLAYAPAQLTLRQAMEIALFDDGKQGRSKSVGDHDPAAVLVESNNDFQKPNWIRRILSSLIELSDRDEGRLQVDRAAGGDDEIISFAHSSVKDYLENEKIVLPGFHISDNDGKLLIFNSCHAYIKHYDDTCLKPNPDQSEPQKYPLLYYVCQHLPSYSLELHSRNNTYKTHIVTRLKTLAAARIYSGPTLSAEVALESVAALGNRDLVKALLDAGVEFKKTTVSGRTILHVAVERNHGAIVKLLLRRGAPVNLFDKSGETPLIPAARNRSEKITSLLIGAGADPRACYWPATEFPQYRIPAILAPFSFLDGPRRPFRSNPLDPQNSNKWVDYISMELVLAMGIFGLASSFIFLLTVKAMVTGPTTPIVYDGFITITLGTAFTFGIVTNATIIACTYLAFLFDRDNQRWCWIHEGSKEAKEVGEAGEAEEAKEVEEARENE